jgi:RIO kinase 1
LLRDVNALTARLGRFAPELLDTWYGEEMWSLYEAGKLQPDTELTGVFVPDTSRVDVESIRHAIEDARQEAIIRQQGREAAQEE